jgi:hypothetical protein
MVLYQSPKLKVLLMSGIMAAFGVSVSITIIAAGGGFSGPGPSLLNPPTTSDLWAIGKSIHSGTTMNYSLTKIGNHSSPWSSLGEHSSLINSLASIEFVQEKGNHSGDSSNSNNWQAIIRIINETRTTTTPITSSSKQGTVLLSKNQLTNAAPINQDFIPYYEPIESSILELRDIALGPEYLVVGAQWNSITVGVTTVPVKIIGQEKIQINAGTFSTYILSYKIGSQVSRIWIAHDVPLPVKAEVYNAQSELQYTYNLVFYKR